MFLPIDITIFIVKKKNYLIINQVSKLWELSPRSVRNYCATGRIEGAVLKGKTWYIPKNTVKPERLNAKKENKVIQEKILIEAKNLKKTYGKGSNAVEALKGLDFMLPEKGMIFFLGKSGSGKSTLLNILGGLDDATSGELIIGGRDICKLKPHELDNYRNYHVGIIYQNYNLFEEDTVINNIKIASDISENKPSDNEIDELLNKLDLIEKKTKLVRELSGGQKQRVAIARALIKNPKIILADEPTGNLDSKTSKTIFDFLKEISKTKLVIIISHDRINTFNYADRVLELYDGQIESDKIRNINKKAVDSKGLVLEGLDDKQITELNALTENKGYKFYKKVDDFISYKSDNVEKAANINLKGRNRSWKNAFRLSLNFLNSSKGSLITAIIVASVILGLVSLAHGFANFDGKEAIYQIEERYDSKNIIYNKAYSFTGSIKEINKDYAIEVTNGDVEKFKNTEYKGNIYYIYNTPVYNGSTKREFGQIKDEEDIKNFYISHAYGTIVTDENYLYKIFGNELKVLAGSLDNIEQTTNLIVTDYFADAILANGKVTKTGDLPIYSLDPNDPYQGLLGSQLSNRYTIGAIIKTDYKEKYSFLIDLFAKMAKEKQNKQQIAQEIYTSELFERFIEDVQTVFGMTYSLNPNFQKDFVSKDINFSYLFNCFGVSDNNEEVEIPASSYIYSQSDLKDEEISLRADIYDVLFKTSIEEEKYITIKNFGYEQNTSSKARVEKRLKVINTFPVESSLGSPAFFVSRNNLIDFAEMCFCPFALCFDNVANAYPVYEVALSNMFYAFNHTFGAVFNVIDIVNIFSTIFLYIAIVLIALVTIVMVSHNLRIIRKNQYRIGVYKSLGYSSAALSESTLINTLYMMIFVFIISLGFTYFLSFGVNNLLGVAFVKFLGSEVYMGLTLVSFSMPVLTIYVALAAVLSFLTTFIPMIAIRKIKPNLIINRAE